MAIQRLILIFLTFGFLMSTTAAFACHKKESHTSDAGHKTAAHAKEHCCTKSKSTKKAFCKQHKRGKNCNCQCAYGCTILAIYNPPQQSPRICAIAIKKNYKSIVPAFVSGGYYYPWVPPKIS